MLPHITTCAHYRVKLTGDIGMIMPCPSDDPVILEFRDGTRDAFRLQDIELTEAPVTPLSSASKKPNKCYRINKRTIQKYLDIRTFLMNQTQPIRRSTIESALGYHCLHFLTSYPTNPYSWNLESANLVRRVSHKGSRLQLWELTDLGKVDGESIIKSIKKRN